MAFLEEIRALEAFTGLPRARRNLVIYSEGPEYWPHYRGIVRELIETHRCPFAYVASSPRDPGLKISHPLARTFNIGTGGVRVNFFESLDADVMVLTMPDLGQLTLKRSASCGEYVYVFHSPVSTHMIYREGAFDRYDTVFCAGPHHETEIRRREAMEGLPPKRLFAHGYGRLDDVAAGTADDAPRQDGPLQVLVAPSWGPDGLFETLGPAVVEPLLAAGLKVVARPHPQTSRLAADRIQALQDAFGAHERFTLETDMADKRSFHESDVMISDWSGAALDFAFAHLRPVVFIDTPRKVNNPRYQDLGIEPMEAAVRERIGAVVDPAALDTLADTVRRMAGEAGAYRQAITQCRDAHIHNFGGAARAAAAELARIAFSRAMDGQDGDDPAKAFRERTFAELAACPEGDTADAPLALVPLLRDMARGDGDQAGFLDALCRRIDVFKTLHAGYDAALARPAGAKAPAPLAAYPALCLLLIDAAADEAEAGRALKQLNAAGNALDAWLAAGGGAGAPVLESLLARAHDRAAEAGR
ncbi:hypothetical protein FKB34_06335 [Glycocaulis profundi]|nr:hypothetical protein FKB34_06335 [Glycocaulis profundi]